MVDIGLDRFRQAVDQADDRAHVRLGERGDLTTARHSFGGRVVRWLVGTTGQDRIDNQRLLTDLQQGLKDKYGDDIGTEAFLQAVPEGSAAAVPKPLTVRQVRRAVTHAESASRAQLTLAACERARIFSPGHRKFAEITAALGIDPATLSDAQQREFKTELRRRVVEQAALTGAPPKLAEVADLAKQALRQTLHLPRPPGAIARPVERALGDRDRDQLQALATELGNHLAGQLRGLDREQQLNAVMSRGDAAKEALLHELAQELPDSDILTGSYRTADPVLQRFLDDVYEHAVTNLSDRRVDDLTVVVDGKTYTKNRELTRSGFGAIDLYEAASGEKIVIKTPLGATHEKFDEAVDELSAHRWAAGGDPTNLIGLKGALRTPDGMLQIALEYAPRGDAQGLIGDIDAALAGGRITQEQANLVRLTLLKDMAQAVQHVQETRGMVHLDVKAPNFFVDGDGVVKLGDFGTATKGKVRELYRSPIDNPLWASPELAKGASETKRKISAAFQKYRADRTAALRRLKELNPNASPEELTALGKDVNAEYEAKIRQEVGEFAVTGKTDTWSLGVDAYRMFVGKYPFGQKGDSDLKIENAVIDYQKRGAPIGLPRDASIGMGPLDRRELDVLVGGMLHPDPKQRPSLAQVLASPLLARPEVGGPESRRLIRQLTAASAQSTES
jgi:serine/threonine protein kinase